ncbi:antA/AntB antirepressor family protein [Spirosoma sp.]|uniref:antA/AntB antirepressor family protein n=1 Tax=Spirosoma sp. TaxID=1899569 RepID=UPI00260E9CCB|nr:antA/AntB antirepressor family protein [Spirosoma sp.]MCX6218338.1 antA/AntB antirepressor family protein [Spirosoma sp.]
MNELIRITTNEQGSEVVSARELYAFLEVKQQFSDWIKNRIIRYGFREGEDYVSLSKTLESDDESIFHKTMKNSNAGRTATDYALTLDMAKELSMVERNDKGKQARQYFIEAEKALRQVVSQPAQLSSEQMLIQLATQTTQLLASQQQQLNQLRADVEEITANRRLPRPAEPTRPHESKTKASLRQSISRKVNEYCGIYNAEQQETYNYLYKRMQQVFGIDIRRLRRGSGESYLDAIERYGHLEKLYSLVVAELEYIEE